MSIAREDEYVKKHGWEIQTPTKPGAIFSHWSKVKPGTTIRIVRSDGTSYDKEMECPPFDFTKEVITEDTALYAVWKPIVNVEFRDGDELLTEEKIPYGSRARDPRI